MAGGKQLLYKMVTKSPETMFNIVYILITIISILLLIIIIITISSNLHFLFILVVFYILLVEDGFFRVHNFAQFRALYHRKHKPFV